MSFAYDCYLALHRECVVHGVKWMLLNIPENILYDILPGLREYDSNQIVEHMTKHDISKYNDNEYNAYDEYFYNNAYATEEGKQQFDLAFLNHIHENPHHWQHWVLVDDDSTIKPFDMPDIYILEMICDWWSFSWKTFVQSSAGSRSNDQLMSIFKWWDSHKNKIVMTESTREKVEKLLDQLKNRIPFSKNPFLGESTVNTKPGTYVVKVGDYATFSPNLGLTVSTNPDPV